jgi:hypothetical protein
MPEEPAPKPQTPETDAGHVPMEEEMDRAKWTLPPMAPVLIAAGVIAIIVGIFAWTLRWKPTTSSKILDINIVEQTDQKSVLVGINLDVANVSKNPVWLNTAKVKVDTDKPEPLEDEAASPVDFERYFTAYPALREKAIEPLRRDTKIDPNGHIERMVVVGFPVSKAEFERRKSLVVTIDVADQYPIVIKQ